MPHPELPDVFALLDDAQALPVQGETSQLYTGYAHTNVCENPAGLDACWAAAWKDLTSGLHAVVLADYEWGVRLQDPRAPAAKGAALRLMMFRQLRRLDDAGVQAFLRQADAGAEPPTAAGVLNLQPDVGEADFHKAIAAIQEAIRCGEVYQVNYSYRLSGRAWGSPVALYRRLRLRGIHRLAAR